MSIIDKYEPVIGLEIHAQLLTESKAFASDPAAYGNAPNENISVITLGYPGTLPKMNKKQVEYAIRMGHACNCAIREENHFSRKNYFYADLPKGYQITQYDTPICTKGFLKIKVNGVEKNIGITRIHLEEDAGKSIHDQDPYYTLVDYNRAGVPLIEVVTEPDLRSAEEAYEFVTQIRKIVRYLGICDGNMEEGSLRCDANISVRLKGAKEFGAKVEVKNMNSIRNVKRAIEHEIERQVQVLEHGGTVSQDTRSFDAVEGTTFTMRSKEMLHDYRYFPEPDLPPVVLSENYIKGIKNEMPALPEELFQKYVKEFGLSEYDAGVLTDEKEIALYFEELISRTDNYKAAANWVMGPVKSFLNENAVEIQNFPLSTSQIAGLIAIIDEGKVSHSAAAQKIFPFLTKNPGKKPEEAAKELNLIQESDEGAIMGLIKRAVEQYPDKAEAYRQGNKNLLGLFMGEVMKLSKGKADPKKANQLLREELEKS